MRRILVSVSLLALVLSACGGGGGNDSPSSPSGPPATTPPPAIAAPVVVATASPTSGLGPLTVGFDASKSTDPQNLALSYTWDWGDGTVPHGTGATPAHTYTAPGTYGATVIVSNGTAQATSVPILITVNTPTPTASFTYTIDGLTVNVDASGTANPANTTLTYNWDFSDGTMGTGVKTAHTYSFSSRPYIQLTVTDSAGNKSQYAITVQVLQPTVGGVWRGTEVLANGDKVDYAILVSENGSVFAEGKNETTGCSQVFNGGITTPNTQLNFAGYIDGILSAPAGQIPCVYPDGSTSVSGTVFGTVVAQKSIQITVKTQTTAGTSFSDIINATFDDIYIAPRKPTDLNGTYTDPTTGLIFTFAPDSTYSRADSITATDPTTGCVLNGRAFQDDIYHNSFTLEGNLTGCQGQYANLIGTSGTGLMVFDDRDTPSQIVGGITAWVGSTRYIVVFDYPKTQ
jgi:PKD repeat protein